MFLIVGLGNPGKQYLNSRHNVGFIAVDYLVNRLNFLWTKSSKFSSEIASGSWGEHRLLLAKPQTYMNSSGGPVQSICSYYKIEPQNIIVIHDDIDLSSGTIRFKLSGGNGGHNGLKSIDQYIGSNYYRIRIGVGRPDNSNIDVADFVLGKFMPDEYEHIMKAIRTIEDNFNLILSDKIEEFKEKISHKPA